jgi:hypothetical protein
LLCCATLVCCVVVLYAIKLIEGSEELAKSCEYIAVISKIHFFLFIKSVGLKEVINSVINIIR